MLVVGEGGVDDALDAGVVDDGGEAEADAGEAIVAVGAEGNGEDAAFVAEDGSGDALQCHAHSVIGGALGFDDVVGGVADLPEDMGAVFVGAGLLTDLGAVGLYGDAGDVGHAPDADLGVAVLADDVGVDVAGVHFAVIAEEISKAGGVEDGARTEDAAVGPAG